MTEGFGEVAPAFAEDLGIGVVVIVATWGDADVVADDACEGDVEAESFSFEFHAKVYVFASVAVGGFKSASDFESFSSDGEAGGGDGVSFDDATAWWVTAVFVGVGWHAVEVEENSGMIDEPRGEISLYVADCAGLGERIEGGDHWFEPAREELEVVVDEDEDFACRGGCSGIVGAGEAEVGFVVEKGDVGSIGEGFEVLVCSIGGCVVDEDDLMFRRVYSRF